MILGAKGRAAEQPAAQTAESERPQSGGSVRDWRCLHRQGNRLRAARRPLLHPKHGTAETAQENMPRPTAGKRRSWPEAPPVQATEAEENSTNQHTPENSVVLTPEEIRAALDAGAAG